MLSNGQINPIKMLDYKMASQIILHQILVFDKNCITVSKT